MKEFVEKLIGRLEKENKFAVSLLGGKTSSYIAGCCDTNKKTIEIVNQLAEEYNNKDCSQCSRRSWYQIGYKDAEKKFAEEMGVSKMENITWIPCSERLPEKEVDVLVCFSNDMDCVIAYRTKMMNKNLKDVWVNSSTAHIISSNIIAWMPLPTPYQKGE